MKTANQLGEIALIENKPFSARKFAYAAFSLIFLLILSLQSLFAAKRYSVATGNFSTSSVWSLTSGGSGSAGAPGATDTAYVEGGFTVTLSSNTTVGAIFIQSGSTFSHPSS